MRVRVTLSRTIYRAVVREVDDDEFYEWSCGAEATPDAVKEFLAADVDSFADEEQMWDDGHAVDPIRGEFTDVERVEVL